MRTHEIMKRVLILSFVFSLTCFLAVAEEYTISTDGKTYIVILPEGYLPYTSEMGADSPMIKAFGADSSTMDLYIKALDCDMCCVHKEQLHQMWIAIRDRSAGFPFLPDGAEPSAADLNSYYTGVSYARGKYSTETHNGHTYYIFADGRSINKGGINYYISTFLGKNEVIVRWESGNGLRTDADIEALKGIIYSIVDNAIGESRKTAQTSPSFEEKKDTDSSEITQQYYFAEIPAVLHLSEENLNIYTPSISQNSLTMSRLSNQEKKYMDLEMYLMDYIKAFISYPDTRVDSFCIEIKVKDNKYTHMASWDKANEPEIASMMNTIFEGQIPSYSIYRTDTTTYTVFKMPSDKEALRYVTLKNGDLIYLHMRRKDGYGTLTDEDYELLKSVADSLEFLDR